MTDAPALPLLSRRVRVGGAVAVALAIVVGSLRPEVGVVDVRGPLVLGVDKWLHAAGYAVLTAAVWYALVRPDDGGRAVTVAVALVAAVGLGLVVELAQTAVPGRAFDPLDLVANAVGAAAAAVPLATVCRRVRLRPRP